MDQKISSPLISIAVDADEEETFLWVNHDVVKSYGPNNPIAARADAMMLAGVISSLSVQIQPKIFIDGDEYLPAQTNTTIQ